MNYIDLPAYLCLAVLWHIRQSQQRRFRWWRKEQHHVPQLQGERRNRVNPMVAGEGGQ